MADVHPFPTRNLSPSGLQRVLEQLRQAQDLGVDLGSRLTHIAAEITSLREMAHALREAAQQPCSAEDDRKVFEPDVESRLVELAFTVDRMADCAAQFLRD
jgi:hypothetical protein